MQSDKKQFRYSYIKKILINGSKPFRYRNRIYSLLGIEENQPSRLASDIMNFPFIEFKYANVNSIENPFFKSELYESEEEEDLIYISERLRNYVQKNGVVQQSVQSEETSDDENLDKSIIQPMTKKIDSVSELNRKEFNPKRSTNSYDLGLNSSELDNLARKYNNQSARLTLLSSNSKILPKNRAKQKDATSEPLKRTVATENIEKIRISNISGKNSKIDIPGKSKNKISFHFSPNLIEDNDIDNQNKKNIKQDGSQRGGIKSQSPKVIESDHTSQQFTYMINSLSLSEKKNIIKNNPTSANPVGLDNSHFTNSFGMSERISSDAIEQIRQSMHELFLKKYKKPDVPKHTNEEKQADSQSNQKPQIPPNSVVVRRNHLNRSRSQCAFWERSYLSRFHLRPLR